jgi:peptidoglycan hydrolase-like protein with peptidoglycan-binding domain
VTRPGEVHPRPADRRSRLRGPLIALAVLIIGVAGCGQIPDHAESRRAASTASTSTARPSGPVSSAAPGSSATPERTAPAPTRSRQQPAHKQPAKKMIFSPGDDGTGIRELQARLEQLSWYQGKITEHFGNSTTAGVRGFQQKRNLPATGTVDQATWSRLLAITKQPSHDQLYNVVHAGPAIMATGDQDHRVRELQARLKQLAWFGESVTGYYGSVTAASVKGFQDKRGLPATGAVDQTTWSRLLSMTHQPTTDELSGNSSGAGGGIRTADLDQRCRTGRAMCIDKTTDQLVWVINGKPQLYFDVRFGADTSPTREGSFTVGWKARQWTSTIYHSEMPYSMFFSGGQAVHYSSDFAARGYYGASHGCINVRDWNGIQTLFDQARVGDKVIVYRS